MEGARHLQTGTEESWMLQVERGDRSLQASTEGGRLLQVRTEGAQRLEIGTDGARWLEVEEQ